MSSLLFTLMSKKFTAHEDGAALGYWVGSTSFGTILGFLMCTFLVYGVCTNWVWCIIIVALLNLLVTAAFKLKLEDNEMEQYRENSIDFIAFAKQTLSNLDGLLLFMINMLMGAIGHGIMLWLPMYLKDQNFRAFEGYISVSYALFSILGATLFGFVF